MVTSVMVKMWTFNASFSSWGRPRAVLCPAHQRRGLLPGLLQPQHAARGAPALRAALLQRPHSVRRARVCHWWGFCSFCFSAFILYFPVNRLFFITHTTYSA